MLLSSCNVIIVPYLLLVLEAALSSMGRVEPGSPRAKLGDVSWVVSTLRSSVLASLHYLVLQLKPNRSGLRAPERPLFTPYHLVLIQVARRGPRGLEFDRQRCADYTAVCWTICLGQEVLNLQPSLGVLTL